MIRLVLRFLSIGLLISIATSEVAAKNIAESYDPEAVYLSCKSELDRILHLSNTRFESDGHQYTTYLVARMAGYNVSEAYVLSYYSQYPDLNLKYSATWVSIIHLLNPFTQKWRSDITGVLHSLHGGDNISVERRRKDLSNAVRGQLSISPLQYQQAGLIIHSFGDSFAHTKNAYKTPEEKAYGTFIGHALDLHEPDQVARSDVFEKYSAYVTHLFHALNIQGNGNEKALMDYIENLRPLVCDDDCSTREIKNMSKAIKSFGKNEGSFSDDIYRCIKSNSPHLDKDEIQSAINTVKSLHSEH